MCLFKNFPKFSYGRFLYNNPKSCRSDRIKALNLFFANTRSDSKNVNYQLIYPIKNTDGKK